MTEPTRSPDLCQCALERDEHAAQVLAMRKLGTIALIAWPLFGFVDWFVVSFVHPGRLFYYCRNSLRAAKNSDFGCGLPAALGVYLALRATGMVFLGGAVWRICREPMVSPRTLRVIDVGVFAAISALISVSCIEFRGIASPFALGIVTVMLCRNAVIADRWQHGLLPIGFTALAHPATPIFLGLLSPEVGRQFFDRAQLGGFLLNEMFIAGAAVLTLAGGHAVWALRRKVFEARSLGRYRLERRIGRGGMGEVWAAHHRALKRSVAVKILRADRQIDEKAAQRFEQEVRATAELTHPNTVRVFDYGITEDGLLYYAMELLEGENLADLVAREGPLPPARAVRLVHQAARALAEAHERGIIHRDIKPENLFVTSVAGERDLLKVLDFGMAKVAVARGDAALTKEGWAVGTPPYMSPEVVCGRAAEVRSDIYSLGCVLYFLLCGSSPFAAEDAHDVLLGHLHRRPPRISSRTRKPLPRVVEAVVMRCLAKEPAQRYLNAIELARARARQIEPVRSASRISAYASTPAAAACNGARDTLVSSRPC